VAIGLSLLAALAAVVPTAGAEPDPVLLVHGWRGHPSTWTDMVARFEEHGRSAVAIDLVSEDNITNAAQIRDFIAAQGWTRVDIVGHSMGGLSSRHYIKFLGPSVVDTYVSLGTPQYGLYSTCLLPWSNGGQMCPVRRFIRNLNAGDDTPGDVAWTTIYSRTDGFVPRYASRLDGGACHVEVPRPGHNQLDNDPVVFEHVLAAVDRQPCTGVMR
jgi:triacylglycerol lipase